MVMSTKITPQALIATVRAQSPAAQAGLRSGDALLRVNGTVPSDFIAYRYLTAEARLELEFARKGEIQQVQVRKGIDQDLGLSFTEDVFDGIRRCQNHCRFCFIDQMPLELRKSLYVKDDDYRLSFLYGNFITLTNLTSADKERIVRDRLSPLYVSVHATSPEVRNRLLGNPRATDIRTDLAFFLAARLRLHLQVVLLPGENDGSVLERTLTELAALGPGIESIAVVPAGLTSYRQDPWPPWDAEGAQAVVDLIERLQGRFQAERGEALVYPADEFYLLAGRPWPSAQVYGDFPQWGNGIGMIARLAEELALARVSAGAVQSVTILTGTLMAPVLRTLLAGLPSLAGRPVTVVGVENRFLGAQVTVAGLLGGADFARTLANLPVTTVALLPEIALRDDLFLDGLSWTELVRGSPVPVHAVPPDGAELLTNILDPTGSEN